MVVAKVFCLFQISRISQIVFKTKANDFQVLAGSASFLLASYCVGAVGGVCALANVLGQDLCDLHQMYEEKKLDEARELQQRLIAPNIAVKYSCCALIINNF